MRKIKVVVLAIGRGLLLLAAVCSAAESGGAALNLQPMPKEARMAEEALPLPIPVCIAERPDATLHEQTAAELLLNGLTRRLQCEPRRGASADVKVEATRREDSHRADAAGTFIVFGSADGALPAEGYTLKLSREGNRAVFELRSNDHGVIYGALTLLQVLEQTARSNHFVLSAPAALHIRDFPTMQTRMSVRLFDTAATDAAAIRPGLERMARMRLNGTWHDPTARNFKTVVDEARRFGIKVNGILSYYGLTRERKRPTCPSNPEDVALVKNRFETAASAGASGLVFLFDDIGSGEIRHAKTCPECARNFKNLGGVQRALTKLMVEAGRQHGLKQFIICPTPYQREWKRNIETWGADVFENYFRELTGDPVLRDVLVFHCDFMPERMKGLANAGLTNYIYWINGLWDTQTWFSHYMGVTRLGWVWYGFRIDEAEGLIQPIPEAVEALRNLPELTKHVFFGTGATDGLLLGGIWAWHPQAYDDDKAREFVAEMLFGLGAWEPLTRYEANVMKLIVSAGAHVNKWTSECSPEVVPAGKVSAEGRARHQVQLRQNLQAASEAASAVKALFEQPARHPLLKPVFPAASALAAMDRALAFYSKRLERQAALAALSVQPFTEQADEWVVGWWQFEDPAKPGADSSTSRTEAKVHGHPESGDGVSGKALRLHGGQMSGANLVSGVREFLEAANPAAFDMGAGTFSVECWVKGVSPGWHQFVGNRQSTRQIYRLKGWALGFGRDNHIRFTVDDGAKTGTVSAFAAGLADWDREGWNYVVGVRDTAHKLIRLYINGAEAAEAVKDETQDISNGVPLRIGYDGYGGRFLDGLIDEVKVTRRLLTETEIMAKYASFRARLAR
ncbi:MAG: hypothetical protein FJ279_05310 [Planctomycetes bacterium]|nr:hypothetical protein [Planctomycetota bacterium]